jgi:transglutaminase-like putative cysteine protease
MSATARVAVLPGADTPARRAVGLALAGFALAVVLNVQQIAWWVTPLALAMALWRVRASYRTHRLPSTLQRAALVALMVVATVLSLRTLSGLGAGATMLAAMAAAKLTESQRTRDWAIVLGSSFFLQVTACLEQQSLLRVPLYAAELWLLCTGLRALGAGSHAGLRTLAWQSARSLAWSVPLATLLFLFFPRLQGGFLALPNSGEAVTGLGEEMSPGSISELGQSDEPALHVRFDGPLPPPAERYWRGPVMHDFDGYTWRRRPGMTGLAPQLQFTGQAYRYDVTLEPASHGVLIALELPDGPGNASPYTLYSGDYQLLSPRPLLATRSYRLVSYTAHTDERELTVAQRRMDLAPPTRGNARSLELGRELRAQSADPAAFVENTLAWLRAGRFEYTLTPPRLSLDSVDDFLFTTRQGFCGHFASAFATLMRAGGVPARVVTGYLGGEWNPVGHYLLLRQSHAHAWTEVWLDGRGWVRVDPTVAVAPDRLTRDAFDMVNHGERSAARVLRSAPWLGTLIAGFDALNAWWQDGIVGFDFRRQLGLLQKLGFEERDWRAIALLLGGGAGLWLAWIAWTLRDTLRPVRPDALARTWTRFDRMLARAGCARAAHEGPLAFARRVASLDPSLAAPVYDIARLYAQLRYGPPADDTAARLARMRDLVRALPARRA